MSKKELFFHVARKDGFEFVFNSGQALQYPMHTHLSVYTITVIRRGAVCLRRGALIKEVHQPGSMYVLAPLEPHNPIYSDGFDLVSLCMDKKLFQCPNKAELITLALTYARPLADKRLLSPNDIQLIINGIEQIFISQGQQSALLNADQSILLSKSAEVMDRFQFIRYFKKATGLTPHQLLIQNQVREAKKLITESVPLAEVAILAGFYDQSHLNRWFNKAIGLTPQNYKKSCFFLDKQ